MKDRAILDWNGFNECKDPKTKSVKTIVSKSLYWAKLKISLNTLTDQEQKPIILFDLGINLLP